MNDTLRFIGVTKDATTAGPGKRLELFTKGCIRGVISPCEGCFNESTWTFEGKFKDMTIDDTVYMIERDAWNRQVTFCGGEPILQARALMKVAKRLKQADPTFHFVMYTAYKLDTLMKYGLKFTWLPKHGEAMKQALMDYSRHYHIYDDEDKIVFTILEVDDVRNLMKYIDIIVDGDYKHELRLTNHETMHEGGFIGSSNQRVFYCKEVVNGDPAAYNHADEHNEIFNQYYHCECCGHALTWKTSPQTKKYCNETCESRHTKRKEEMKLLGGV